MPPKQQSFAPALTPKRSLATGRTVLALILREMSTRYGRTPGGYIWSVLEPLAGIVILSFAFSLVMKTPSLGTSFLLYYSTGYLAFNLYQVVSSQTANAINFSRPLLKYPAVTWVDAVAARFLLNSLTGVLVTALLMSGILNLIDNRSILDFQPIVSAMALAMLLGLGVGTLNCVIIGLIPVWGVAWSIITRPLFLASGVIFLYDNMPPFAREVLIYNPLIHIVGLMRTGFYPTYTAAHVNVTYVLFVSMVTLALGVVLMGRYHREILNNR